jgi:hypothetical protein
MWRGMNDCESRSATYKGATSQQMSGENNLGGLTMIPGIRMTSSDAGMRARALLCNRARKWRAIPTVASPPRVCAQPSANRDGGMVETNHWVPVLNTLRAERAHVRRIARGRVARAGANAAKQRDWFRLPSYG